MLYDNLVPSHLGLPAPPPQAADAWTAYLKGLRSMIAQSWNDAASAYLTLKKMREGLGLPFIEPVTEAGVSTGAWTPAHENMMLRLQAVNQVLLVAIDDVLAGKREFGYDDKSGDFTISKLPGDTVVVRVQSGQAVLLNESGEAIQPTGPDIGQLGWVWAVVAGLAVVAVGTYFVVDSNNKAATNIAQQKQFETVKQEQTKQLQAGATPEQVEKLTTAMYSGAANVETAKAAGAKEEPAGQLGSTIRTVAWVGLGIAGIWLIGSLFAGRMGGGSPALARNPSGSRVSLSRVRLNQGGYDSHGRYFGVGSPLYHYTDDDYVFHGYVRGGTRDEAKQKVRELARNSSRWPSGRQVEFYRAA